MSAVMFCHGMRGCTLRLLCSRIIAREGGADVMSSVIEYVVLAEGELRRLVRTHLSGGVVLVPSRHLFEVFDGIVVRVTASHRSLDLDAVVAIPRVVDRGRDCVGVHLRVERAQWAGLEWLLNALVRERIEQARRGDTALPDRVGTGEFVAIDDSGDAAVLARFSGSYPSVDAAPPETPLRGTRRRKLLVNTPVEPWADVDTVPIDPAQAVAAANDGEHEGSTTSALRLLVADRPDEARAVLAAALEHAPHDADLLSCWALLTERARVAGR